MLLPFKYNKNKAKDKSKTTLTFVDSKRFYNGIKYIRPFFKLITIHKY